VSNDTTKSPAQAMADAVGTPNGTIEFSQHGTVFTGDGVSIFQMEALRGALRLEKIGLKRRGRSALSIAKSITGLRTNDHEAHRARLAERIEALRAGVLVVNDDKGGAL